MIKFEEKDMYEIKVDKAKNRIYLIFWENTREAKDVPRYVEHVRKAAEEVKEGFTLLADISPHRHIPKFSLTKVMKESQAIFLKKGVSKTAVVRGKELALQKMFLNVTAKLSGMQLKSFVEPSEAEKWLDEKE